jgi:hypothetical protein
MTALPQLGWAEEKYTDCNREAGDCPVCGEAFDVTRTVPEAEGDREGAFYAHSGGDFLIPLCIEWEDGTVTRRINGRRTDWFGER